jgi:5-methylcytosine-specific restriction protein A
MEHTAPWSNWYFLQIWRRRSRAQLRAHPLCAMHLAKGEAVPATVADHVIPHKGNWILFTKGVLQSLCASCHNRTKQQEEALGFRCDIGEDGWPIDRRHPVYGAQRRIPD